MIEEPSIPANIDSYSDPTWNIDSVIKLIAILHVFTGFLFIPYIQRIFTNVIISGPAFFTFISYFVGGLMLTTVPLFFVLGVAIWSVKAWAWKSAIIINSVCLILTIFGQIIFPAILNIVLLLMLLNTDVKTALQT